MKKIIFLLFFIIVITQLGFLGFRIYKYEDILRTGKVFYFTPIPIDPRDLFHGRYVTLNFKNQKLKSDKKFKNMDYYDFMYVSIQKDKNQTIIKNPSPTKPKSGDFLKVSFRGYYNKHVHFRFLFDRFYMNEYKSKKVEKAYNKLAKNDKMLARVRVKNGFGVIEDIYINSISVKDFVKK